MILHLPMQFSHTATSKLTDAQTGSEMRNNDDAITE